MTQRVIKVASAAPAAPISGAPRLPLFRIQLSAALSRLAESAIVIPAFGRPMPSRKNVVATHIRIAGMPAANMRSARPPPRASSGLCPNSSGIGSPQSRMSPVTGPRAPAIWNDVDHIGPQSSVRPAPSAWAVNTIVPTMSPMPITRRVICGARLIV